MSSSRHSPNHVPGQTIGTVVIGAGQAGLAISRCLTDRGHDHVVLDRGQVAQRWRCERWDSLRLLTPNWMTRLPGHQYAGPDPDGYMSGGETVRFLTRYAVSFDAPVIEHTEVLDVSPAGDRFRTATTAGTFISHNVVIATGWCDRPFIPYGAAHLSARLDQLVPSAYRNPSLLSNGGVLVVGASATGVQLAHELRTAGRTVVLAVGRHQRIPRTYRGMDIYWWLDHLGMFDRTIDDVSDAEAARAEPSPQLVGRPDHRTLDLAALQHVGVVLTGRFQTASGHHVGIDPNLAFDVHAADARLCRLLDRIDSAIAERGLDSGLLPADRPRQVLPDPSPASLDLRRAGIGTVIWATGFRRSYPWLHLSIVDADGEIRQRRGVTPVPGAFVLGQRFQHFRNSSFIDGVGRDAMYVADRIIDRQRTTPTSLRPKGTP